MKKPILFIITALLLCVNNKAADLGHYELVGHSLTYCVTKFGPAHYQDTIKYLNFNYVVDRYFIDVSAGTGDVYWELWVSQTQMGKMPPRYVVAERTWTRHTINF